MDGKGRVPPTPGFHWSHLDETGQSQDVSKAARNASAVGVDNSRA
jgi:hypothetical protein